MYNIDFTLADSNWQVYEIEVDTDTMNDALMAAYMEIDKVLQTETFEVIRVSDSEFQIWAFGVFNGYLSIKQVNPKT